MNPQLDNYIKQAREVGQSDEQIKQALMQSGWSQTDINQAFGLPVAPKAPVIPPPPMHPSMAGVTVPSEVGDIFDIKTKETVIWAIAGYGIRSVIVGFATAMGSYLFLSSIAGVYGIMAYYHPTFYFNFGGVIFNSIFGGLIFGLILAKLYPKLQEINNKFLGGRLNNFYRMIFYPSVIAGLLSLVLLSGFSLFLGGGYFIYLLLIIISELVGSFLFAKLMVNKVGKYYPASK